jgi:ankyrin repeat protein
MKKIKKYSTFLNENYTEGDEVDTLEKLYNTMLSISARNNFVEGVEKAIELGADTKILADYFSNACSNGYIELVEFIVKNGIADVNKSDGYYTPLGRAIQRGRLDLVKKLIELGANIFYGRSEFLDSNRERHKKLTAIDLAEEYKREEILRYLLSVR